MPKTSVERQRDSRQRKRDIVTPGNVTRVTVSGCNAPKRNAQADEISIDIASSAGSTDPEPKPKPIEQGYGMLTTDGYCPPHLRPRLYRPAAPAPAPVSERAIGGSWTGARVDSGPEPHHPETDPPPRAKGGGVAPCEA